jgi:hypothetical protein
MLTNEMPVVSSNLAIGYGVYGTCDTYSTSLPNNGALNPVGSVRTIPAPAQSGLALAPAGMASSSAGGYGCYLTVKYVRYKSTANPAMVAGPAPVYYTDETFTTVSGVYSEGNPAATGEVNSAAGWLLLNTATASTTGTGIGSLISATILNGNYVFIAVMGFVPLCWISNQTDVTGTGLGIIGASGNWSSDVFVNNGSKPIGYTWSALSNTNYADVLVTCGIF